jgi:predicted RNA-binding protein with TRAM domain
MRNHSVGDSVRVNLDQVSSSHKGKSYLTGTVTKVEGGPRWDVTTIKIDGTDEPFSAHESLVYRR